MLPCLKGFCLCFVFVSELVQHVFPVWALSKAVVFVFICFYIRPRPKLGMTQVPVDVR